MTKRATIDALAYTITFQDAFRERPPGEVMSSFAALREAERALRNWHFRYGIEEIVRRIGDDATLLAALEEGLSAGRIVAIRTPGTLASGGVVPSPKAPERPRATGLDDTMFEVAFSLFDPFGRPFEGVPFEVKLPAGTTKKGTFGEAESRFDSPLSGTCALRIGPPKPAPLAPAAPAGLRDSAVSGARAISRAAMRGAFAIGTRTPAYAFQVWRRTVDTIEIEHFAEDSAVILPGFSPKILREQAQRVTGVEAVLACLAALHGAPGALAAATGHHAQQAISAARAANLAALLKRQRDAWVKACLGAPGQAPALWLRWASEALGWPCAPERSGSVEQFKRAYNLEVERRKQRGAEGSGWGPEPIDVNACFDAAAWGACFELFWWALRPVKGQGSKPHLIVNNKTQTYPVLLAKIATSDERNFKDLYPLNPGRQKPGDMGWLPLHVGDQVFLPEDPRWDLNKLRAAGYDVIAAGPPVSTGPGPIPADRPLLVAGCGAPHMETPDFPRRRAITRAAELVIARDGLPIVVCEGGACDTSTDELHDPMSVILRYLPVPHVPLSVPHHVDFFVYPKDSDGRGATNEIFASHEAPLRLGWLISGEVKRVQVGSEDRSILSDVTPHTRVRNDGHAIGCVPVMVPPALLREGAATYRLHVTWMDGTTDDLSVVRVSVPGPPPSPATHGLARMSNAEHAAALGLGEPYALPGTGKDAGLSSDPRPILSFGLPVIGAVPIAHNDEDKESFPIPRALWPQKAHAAAVLSFRLGAASWANVSNKRQAFADMANELIDLGKGTRVDTGVGVLERPQRAIAYGDAVTMGERASIRRAMFGPCPNASSCGMFVRSLYKMIGVRDGSYAKDYVFGTVIANEERIARAAGALVRPFDRDAQGALRLPDVGDAVYAPKGDEQHIFIIAGRNPLPVKRKGRDGNERVVELLLCNVAQGGQMLTKEFPEDGGCQATNQGVYLIDPETFYAGSRKIVWWIDIEALAKACDSDPIVIPVRNARY